MQISKLRMDDPAIFFAFRIHRIEFIVEMFSVLIGGNETVPVFVAAAHDPLGLDNIKPPNISL